MGDDLAFAVAALHVEIAAAQSRLASVGRGLGAKVFAVFEAIFQEIRSEANAVILSAASSEPDEQPSLERSAARILVNLRAHDALVAEYLADVGRDDLPVGYMMLIDSIASTLLPPDSDYLVHIRDEWDYSTSPIKSGLVVHLPAVSSANAFWSPILVHEIAHAAFERVRTNYQQVVGGRDEELAALAMACPTNSPNDEEYRDYLLPRWAEELFCDAVACLVSGPSFILALASRLVGAEWALKSEHPPTELRISLCLEVFRRSGWLSVLEHHAPDLSAWLEGIGSRRPKAGSNANVLFLYEAAELLLSEIVDLARSEISEVFEPDEASSRRVLEATRHFRRSILPLSGSETNHFNWEVLLGAWLFALETREFASSALAAIPHDSQLNGLVIKTVELARIEQLWIADDTSR
jgi:hypothetical protein